MKKGRPKLYFAHSKLIYNTELEKQQLEQIKNRFPDYEIINPNGDFIFSGMDYCYILISECDLLVFTSVKDYIGKGVFSEIGFARDNKIKTLWLKNKKFYSDFTLEIYDFRDWRFRYGKIRNS